MRVQTYSAGFRNQDPACVPGRWRFGGTPVAKLLLSGLAFFGLLSSISAANLCVRPQATGSADGSDWNNALGADFTPVRGNTYYLAGGSYGFRIWNTATDGVVLITIKKATATDRGSSEGWDDSIGSEKAVFTAPQITTSNWVFEGVTGSEKTGHGLEFVGQTSIGSEAGGAANNITISHVNAHSFPSTDGLAEKGDQDRIGWPSTSFGMIFKITHGGTALNVNHCYLHRVFGCPFQLADVTGLMIERNYIEKNKSTAAWHSAGIADHNSSNVTVRWNKWVDIEGSAFIEVIAPNPSIQSHWNIYGNLFWHTGTWNAWLSAAIVNWNDSNNHGTANDWKIVNNTFTNISGIVAINFVSPDGKGIVVQNNLFWQNRTTDVYANYVYMSLGGSGNSYDYNYYSAAASPGFFKPATHEPPSIQGPNCLLWPIPAEKLFVDAAAGDFHIANKKLAATAGTNLGPPFNEDLEGRPRPTTAQWTVGAFEVARSTGPTLRSR